MKNNNMLKTPTQHMMMWVLQNFEKALRKDY